MYESIEIIVGILAILMGMYNWVKKPIDRLTEKVAVHEEKHKQSVYEVSRLRDGQHDIRGEIQKHEARITILEDNVE